MLRSTRTGPHPILRGLAAVCAAIALTAASTAARQTSAADAPAFPGTSWEAASAASWSTPRLEALRVFLKSSATTAMLVLENGRPVFEYGDLSQVSKVASVRKSVLALLYGKAVESGRIDLDKSVKALGLGDEQPFLPLEEEATLFHLLAARSGVYLPAGNAELTVLSPRRGSHPPGTYFQYQNWDFNAAGAAFEKITGRDIFDAVEQDLARPLQMQDFSRARQRKNSSMPDSRFPEYAMYFSTRDMARLGLLMQRGCAWREAQIVPRSWCRRITTLVTPHRDIHPFPLGSGAWASRWGYGLLWWVWDAGEPEGTVTGPYSGAYSAMGAFGQYITVLPVMDLVVAHKVDFDEAEAQGRPVPKVQPHEFDTMLQLLIAAKP